MLALLFVVYVNFRGLVVAVFSLFILSISVAQCLAEWAEKLNARDDDSNYYKSALI